MIIFIKIVLMCFIIGCIEVLLDDDFYYEEEG